VVFFSCLSFYSKIGLNLFWSAVCVLGGGWVFLLFYFGGLSEGSVFGSVVLRPSPYRRAFWSFWV
jgi:hypothetical protein